MFSLLYSFSCLCNLGQTRSGWFAFAATESPVRDNAFEERDT